MGSLRTMDYVEPFDEALKEAVTSATGETRRSHMAQILNRPDARKAHPTFEHLLPIHIAAGVAPDEKAVQVFTKAEMSVSWAQYRFGEVAV